MKIKYFNTFIFTLLVNIILSCHTGNKKEIEIYFCDAEKTNSSDHVFIDKFNPQITYANAETKSSENVYKGNCSVKLDSVNKFGMSIKIKNIKPEQRYKISVVRYGNPKAYLIASIGKEYYEKFGEQNIKPTEKKGWFIIETIIQIPYSVKSNELNIYVWNTTNKIAFFDNLKIEKLKNFQDYHFKQAALYLYIDATDMQKLESIRTIAFRKGILETTDDNWVKGSMFYEGSDYKIKLRFKGDWLDHLEGNKWSFRIKIKKGKAWKGMKTFSIQNPKSRHFLDEWFAHKLMLKEDILTTRYDFIPVYLNNKSLGIYAYEEHFEKQLVESKKRREGVIVKFSEDQFWASYRANGNTDSYPVYEASDIIPFKENKILKNESLYKQFLTAQNLLYEYKYQLKRTSDIFDIKKFAKFYAAVTLTKMNHSLRWHNMRFYYNPVLCKLEPIVFDGYTTDGYMAWGGPVFGNFEIPQAEKSKIENISNYFVFTDTAFLQEYLHQLEIFSSDTFINNRFADASDELKFYETELQKEFINYTYDTAFISNNAKKIRHDLNIYKLRIKDGKYKNINFIKPNRKKYSQTFYENLIPLFINAFTENKTFKNKTIKIENYLPFDIEIIGYSETDLFISEKISPVIVQAFSSEKNTSYLKTNRLKANYLSVRIPGKNNLFFIKIFPWNSPIAETPLQTLLKNNIYMPKSGNNIIFKNRKYTFDKTLIIPNGYYVIFEPGAELDLINKAGFISYSPVFMNGTENNKVKIHSSDNSAQSFTVLQAEKKSEIKNVIFENLNTLNYDNWVLTGSVNFYESEVNIEHSEFLNNHCEDALNTIRSNFTVSNCNFENIYGDAFDSDFCIGTLINSYFNNIGNDAIDFSGSKVQIKGCNIKNLKDKGISGGEKSDIRVDNCTISNADIAVASKDGSLITLNNCKIENCRYGFTAFHKKAEYGPAKLYVNNLKQSGIIYFYLIEKNSKLKLNNKIIEGYDKNTAKKFY